MKKILFVFVLFIFLVDVFADTTYVRMPGIFQSAFPRPTLTNSITTEHFVIHYQSPTTTTYANNTAQYVEYAYEHICDGNNGMGWKTPPYDDNRGGNNLYDIYIVDYFLGDEVDGFTQPEVIGNWTYEFCPSFILIQNMIETENELKMVVAQCFSYSTQLAYSYKDGMYDTWFSKNTAVWIAEEIYNYEFQYYLKYFNVGFDPVDPLDYPEFGIHTTYRVPGNYLYDWGGFLWPKFLAEWQNDPDIIRLIWDRFNSNPGDHVLSDIDYVLQNGYSTNVNEAAKFYAEWRYFTGDRDDGEHFQNAEDLPTSRLNPSFATPQMYGFGGTVFLQYPATNDIINFNFDGQDGFQWSASVIQEKYEPPSNNVDITLNNNYTGSIDVPTEDCNNLILTPVLLTDGVFKINYSYSAANYSGKKVFFTNVLDGSSNNLEGTLLLDALENIPSGNSKWLRNNSSHNIKTMNERISTPTIVKHNNWNGANSNFFLAKPFTVTTSNYNQDARFKYLNNATIRNVIDGMNFNHGVPIKFNDPWYVKDQYDNQSGMGDFISQPSPYYPTGKYNEATGGVFLNQLYTGNNPIYYSVKADAVFDALLYNTGVTSGRNHKFYFKGWSGTEVQFENSNALQTGVVFKDVIQGINPEVQASLKATQISGSQLAFKNNSQRKFLRIIDGALYNVYESMNRVWLEKSTDNGNTWEIINQGNPIANFDSKNPSMCLRIGNLYLVFESEGYLYLYEYITSTNQAYQRVQQYTSTFGYDTNPVVTDCFKQDQWDAGPVIIWKDYCNDGFGGDPGLYYAHINADNYTVVTVDRIPNTNINSFTPSIAGNDPIHSPVTWKNSPMKFNLVWEQMGSTNSSIMYYQCYLNNGTLAFNNYQNISSGSGFTYNSNPSLITIKDANDIFTSRVVWLGSRLQAQEEQRTEKPLGINSTEGMQFKTLFKDMTVSGFRSYGSSSNVPNINKSNNNSVYNFAFSERSNNAIMGVTSLNLSSLSGLDIIGESVQVGNGNDMDDIRGMSFLATTQPYFFKISKKFGNLLPKQSTLSILSGREGVVFKDSAQFYFTVGDVIINEQPVQFIELPDSVLINSESKLNEYLVTEPFTIDNNATFYYSVQYGISDSVSGIAALTDSLFINFKVELVDANTEEIISILDDVAYNKDSIFIYNNIAYQVTTSGLNNRQVKLRLKAYTNSQFNYSLTQRFAEESVLGKMNFKQKSLDINGTIKEYELVQNYPNPFNPSTAIRYQIPQDGIVTLKIYDILGSEVATLVNEQKAAGKYEVNFNASALASGVYLYKIQSGSFVSSKKMILIR
jgi:hypothetical protein